MTREQGDKETSGQRTEDRGVDCGPGWIGMGRLSCRGIGLQIYCAPNGHNTGHRAARNFANGMRGLERYPQRELLTAREGVRGTDREMADILDRGDG